MNDASHIKANRSTLVANARTLLALGAGAFTLARAQTVNLSGSFTGTALDSGWTVGGSGYTPILTAPSIDTAGNGWLRMTSSSTNQATYAYDTNAFAAAHATITATFNYASYNGSGADGITFFLADASKTFGVGAYGGSLGYAQKTAAGGGGADISGMNGGYIGVGIDEFGNFANPTEGRIGGTGSTPNAVSVRGPGQGLTGYNYLGGTGNLGTNSIAFPSSTTRPTGANLRTIEVVISATNQMTVYMATGGSGTFVPLYSIDLSGYTRPDSLIMGFTAGTGGSTDIHEVQNVALSSVVSNLWTNGNGNSAWTTANNWNNSPASTPASGSDVLLDNSFVNTAQNITVAGNQVVRNLQIDAPFSYTLTGGSLEFNGTSAIGPSGIFVSQTHGSAAQTINSNLIADNSIQIQNNSSGALALGGTLNLGSSTATLNGSGSTALSGVISGTGALVQSGTGNTTLSAANTYSGGTTLSAGTLTVNSNTALGTGGLTISGGSLGSTNSSAISNIVTLQGNTTFSGITTSGSLTQNGGNYTLNLANATQSGAVSLSNNNTARTLTVQVDSGNSTISGVIQNGGTAAGNLTKTGNGNLILAGTNTYTGTTNITSGSIVLGSGNVLANTTNVVLGGAGTLNLNGFSQQVGNLTASAGGATVDFGSSTGNNTFVFAKYTPPSSGVLVINNYVSGNDTLATTVASGSQGTSGTGGTQTINNSIYISGYGIATEAASTSSTLFGNAYLLTPAAANTNEWKGTTNSSWNTGTNWNSGAKPTTAQIAVFNTLGTARGNVTLNGANTIAGLQFGNQSTVSYNITGANTLTLSATIPYIQQQSSKDQTLSPSAITLSNTTVADITGAGNLTIGANITGANSTVNLLRDGSGAGKLILTGTNTGLTGSVYVNSGTVQAGSTTALGTNTTYVTGGSTLELSGGISPTNAISVSGAGVGNAGALRNVGGINTLSGTITEAGDTTIAADTGTSLTLSGALNGNNTTTTFAGAGNITVSNAIATGTGNIVLSGTGTTTFAGAANTYTGTTTINSGTLTLAKAANTTAVAGSLVINGGTVNENANGQISTSAAVTLSSGTLALANSVAQTFSALNSSTGSTLSVGTGATVTVNTTGTSTLSGNISGAGSLVTTGAGSVVLGGTNSFSGGTTVGSIVTPISSTAFGTGTVAVNSGGSVETQNTVNLANNFTLNSTGTTAYNGAIENISGSSTLSGTVTLAGSSRLQSDSGTLTASNTVALAANTLNVGGSGNTTISGPLTGTAASSLTKDGTGTLALSGNNASFAGTVVVSAGTVLANAANVFNSSNAITVNTGSILNLNDFNQTIASITSNGTLALGAGTGDTLTLSSGASNLAGSITGAGTIIVGSGATLTLGANFNAPNVNIVLNGGSLLLNGTTDTFGTLTFQTSSTLDFGASTASVLSASNVVVYNGAAVTINNWVNAQDYFYAQNNFQGFNSGTGTFTNVTPGVRGSSPQNQLTFTGFSAANTQWSSDHQITPAPEPATYGMIFIGGALAFFLWRRRNNCATVIS
jgi:autotransporter-associated beta strand protein